MFSLPRASRVKLDVYNILGQRVTRLVDENLAAGSYSVTFDGSDSNGRELASGVYFYKIEAGDFRQSKKMILLK